ncbi:MAG: hypothetical protein U1E25_11075 [Methylocystis sp.]
MKPETRAKRAATAAFKKALKAEAEGFSRLKAHDEERIEKLERLAACPTAGASAEAASAKRKAETLRSKPKPQSKYSTPMPRKLAEFEKLRKTKRKPTTSATPLPLKALAAPQSVSVAEDLLAEIARLNHKIAKLEAALKNKVPGKPGRKPIGKRAMTAAERMRKMRLNRTVTN